MRPALPPQGKERRRPTHGPGAAAAEGCAPPSSGPAAGGTDVGHCWAASTPDPPGGRGSACRWGHWGDAACGAAAGGWTPQALSGSSAGPSGSACWLPPQTSCTHKVDFGQSFLMWTLGRWTLVSPL